MDNAHASVNLLYPDPFTQAAGFAEQVLATIPDVQPLRHRLVLVVGGRDAGKTLCLREIGQRTGATRPVNVGMELSRRLLDLPERERPLRVEELLRHIVADTGDPTLIDNLEVLFEPGLRVDPLALLQSLSRDRTVVASWPGAVFAGQLHYAESGLPEHRRYSAAQLAIVPLDSSTEKDRM